MTQPDNVDECSLRRVNADGKLVANGEYVATKRAIRNLQQKSLDDARGRAALDTHKRLNSREI
jgi:hypothetical protein